jgi:hypothetical protein
LTRPTPLNLVRYALPPLRISAESAPPPQGLVNLHLGLAPRLLDGDAPLPGDLAEPPLVQDATIFGDEGF